MTDTPDPMAAAIARALSAAEAATDAAHEAEAALIARTDIATAMERSTRRTGWIATATGGLAVAVLAMGGLVWLRASADLHDAATIQGEIAAKQAEQVLRLRGIIAQLDAVAVANTVLPDTVEKHFAKVDAKLAKSLGDLGSDLQAQQASMVEAWTKALEQVKRDILETIAVAQLSAPPATATAAAAEPVPEAGLARLEEITTRLEALIGRAAAAPAAAGTPEKPATPPAPPKASPQKPKPKPGKAPQPKAEKETANEFRYP